MPRLGSIQDLENYRQSLLLERDPNKLSVNICVDTGCSALGAEQLYETFKKELDSRRLNETIDLKPTGCPGFCQRGPVVVINPHDIFYQQVDESDVNNIIDQTLLQYNILGSLLFTRPTDGRRFIYTREVPFFERQKRVVMQDNGLIDPTKIEDYVTRGGYEAVARVLTSMDPEEVIDSVEKAGLRGRGGAGFPTGVKWRFCRNSPGERKYIICNADEGDPGAFMDRTVLEGNPHLVLEGMIIGGYAMGATVGYIYVRAEYPTAIRHLEIALEQGRELGLLGQNILGSGFDFDIKIKMGAGAFVCGEETALMQSIEGKRGMPRLRPPFPAQSGLWGCPTNINNVETWANIPLHHCERLGVVFQESARKGARAPRSFRSPAASITPVWWKFPWGQPCGTSSTRSEEEFPRGESLRPPRWEDRRAGAYRPVSRICRWTTNPLRAWDP